MKSEKSPGKNGIPPEAYKLLAGLGEDVLEKIITQFWTDPDFNPEIWKHVVLTILPKSGDLSNPNKWRGIALLDICSKAVSSIAATRLANHLKSFGIEEQAGSTPDKGCADATFTLKTALQTLREHDQESWVLFVDLVKAYDTVNREMLWKILKTLGVPESLIEVLKKLYTDVTINLRVGESLEQFLSTSGVKQGDNLAPVLFIFVIHAVSNSLDKKWDFTTPDLRWYPDTQAGSKPRGQLRGTKHSNKGTMFSFFKSYYVDDTAFILLSRLEVIAASKLIVSHFRRFGLTIHTGSKRKNEGSKTEAIHFPRPGQESTAADMEDIEIDEDRFLTFCLKFKYLGSYFVPELNDTADITERISQARKLFGSMNKQLLGNKKIPVDIRRRLYQALVVNIALWGSESWALKEADRAKLEVFHHGCLRRMCGLTMWDVAEKRITNEQVRRFVDSPTMDSLMETRRCRWLCKLSLMKESRSPRRMLGAWCTTPRPVGRPQQTIRHAYISTLKKLGFEGEKGELREWMTVARDRSAWARKVEYKLLLPPGSFTNLRRH